MYFVGPLLGHILKTNFMAFQTVDPQICSVIISLKKRIHHILCIVFQENYFSCYILLTD